MFLALIVLIGAVVLYFEHKNKKAYNKTFNDFITKMCKDSKIPHAQKLFLIEQMFLQNGYKVDKKDNGLKAQKKLFSLGLFLLTLSFYLLFYLFLQRPHSFTLSLSKEGSCSDSKSL